MYRNKEVKVILSNEANLVVKEINKLVGQEKLNDVSSSINQTLLRSITRSIDILKENPFAGNQVPKGLIPTDYVKTYEVNNVWRIELADRWRMIYTIDGDSIKIITFILEIFNHRDYDKRFGYKH